MSFFILLSLYEFVLVYFSSHYKINIYISDMPALNPPHARDFRLAEFIRTRVDHPVETRLL